MATTTILRPETPARTEMPSPEPDLALFRDGRPAEARLVDLVAFAIAAESGRPATPEAVGELREQASAALSEHAFRYLHNQVEQIRRDAVAEELGRIARPLGFGKLLLANLLAIGLAGLVGTWLALHPATLAGLAGLLAG